jgi:hypothetical protein
VSDILKMINELHAGIPAEEWDKVPDGNGWLPIKTAPHDGTEILGADDKCARVVRWELEGMLKDRWFCPDPGKSGGGTFHALEPTHWQPLPNLPSK